MPRTVNGIGTTYLGASDRHPDGSFVTTEWFVLFSVPLIPLKSQRVTYLGADHAWTRSTNMYNILGPAPMDKKLVLAAYAWIIIPLIVGAIVLSASALFPHGSGSGIGASICGGMVIIGMIFWIFVFPSKYKAR